MSVEGGGARVLGDRRVLDLMTTCLTRGLAGGEVMTLVCSDSTYHLGSGSVGGDLSFTGIVGFYGGGRDGYYVLTGLSGHFQRRGEEER